MPPWENQSTQLSTGMSTGYSCSRPTLCVAIGCPSDASATQLKSTYTWGCHPIGRGRQQWLRRRPDDCLHQAQCPGDRSAVTLGVSMVRLNIPRRQCRTAPGPYSQRGPSCSARRPSHPNCSDNESGIGRRRPIESVAVFDGSLGMEHRHGHPRRGAHSHPRPDLGPTPGGDRSRPCGPGPGMRRTFRTLDAVQSRV